VHLTSTHFELICGSVAAPKRKPATVLPSEILQFKSGPPPNKIKMKLFSADIYQFQFRPSWSALTTAPDVTLCQCGTSLGTQQRRRLARQPLLRNAIARVAGVSIPLPPALLLSQQLWPSLALLWHWGVCGTPIQEPDT
jgi:hypothetical protein